MTQEYVTRAARYAPTDLQLFSEEASLLLEGERDANRRPARPAAKLILLDARGTLLTSPQIADAIGHLRDSGTQRLLVGVGPADGWSASALSVAAHTWSFGRITLPHELARTIAAEQIYRALTILAGHPYHCGH